MSGVGACLQKLTEELEKILTLLAQAQLQSKIAGEPEVVSSEDNYVMKPRQVEAGDDALTSTLSDPVIS